MKKNNKIIPEGPYCYRLDIDKIDDYNQGKPAPVIYCHYYGSKIFNEVRVPWCSFLEQGGIDNDTTDEQYEKLVEYFGSEDNMDKQLPLSLLWDSCKECGENR